MRVRFAGWVICLALTGCSRPPPAEAPQPASPPQALEPPTTSLANPAAENCIAKGGRHTIATLPTGDQYGVCLFEDNRQCEAWAMIRGHCPTGGRRITGYTTEEARYCVITGGEYTITSMSAAPETGMCKLPSGVECDSSAFFRGDCR